MSTDITENATPKTAAQAWAAIHKACGNAVRAQLEDDDVDGAIWYAEKMESVQARFPADHQIHVTQAVVSGDLSEAEKLALGRKDHKITRHQAATGIQVKVVSASDFYERYPDLAAKKAKMDQVRKIIRGYS